MISGNTELSATRSAQELLAEFRQTGRQEPFEEIVRRYGGMVFHACLQVTGNRHDAEDATQAVFLTLAVQAKTSREIRCVGPWLGRVAKRVALDLRKRRRRQRSRIEKYGECFGPEPTIGDCSSALGMEELKAVLTEELHRLPAKYRLPLILQYFGGLRREEIARELKCHPGTLGVRLHRGRELLAARLAERGLVVAGGTLAVALAHVIQQAVTERLVASTCEAASQLAAGGHVGVGVISSHVAAMAQGAASTLLIAKLKTLATVALLAGTAVAAGAEVVARVRPIEFRPPVPDLQAPPRPLGDPLLRRIEALEVETADPTDRGVAAAERDQEPFGWDEERITGLGSIGRGLPWNGFGAGWHVLDDISTWSSGPRGVFVFGGTPPAGQSRLALPEGRRSIELLPPPAVAGGKLPSPLKIGSGARGSGGSRRSGGGSLKPGPTAKDLQDDVHVQMTPPDRRKRAPGRTIESQPFAGSGPPLAEGPEPALPGLSEPGSAGWLSEPLVVVEATRSPLELYLTPLETGASGMVASLPTTNAATGLPGLMDGDLLQGYGLSVTSAAVPASGSVRVFGPVSNGYNGGAPRLGRRMAATINGASLSADKGVLRGWGEVGPADSFDQSGRVVADGQGRDRILDLSRVSAINNSIDNPAIGGGNGWFATDGGKLLLPALPVRLGTGTYTWGEERADSIIDLVNSVRLALVDVPMGGVLGISLLAPDRTDVPALPESEDVVGLWGVEPGSVTFRAIALAIRYDDSDLGSAEREESLRLWGFDGAWRSIDQSFVIDAQNNLISGYSKRPLTYFAVTAPATPEPSGLVMGVIGALLLARRRRAARQTTSG